MLMALSCARYFIYIYIFGEYVPIQCVGVRVRCVCAINVYMCMCVAEYVARATPR